MKAQSKRDLYRSRLAETDLPPLEKEDFKLSYFEFWPSNLFYFPMKLYALYLAARYGGLTTATAANPKIYAGGFVGESKSEILQLVPEEHKDKFAAYASFKRTNIEADDVAKAKELIQAASLTYPMVAKPDEGERGAGVQIVFSDEDLERYIKIFPQGEVIFLQALYDYPAEAGLFYIRKPGEEKGKIFSLTLKYFPKIIGDGKSSIGELIKKDPRAGKIAHIYLDRHKQYLDEIMQTGEEFRIAFAGSHSRGTIFKDGNSLITEKMEKVWDDFAKTIPELYFCRFDIRFHNMQDLESLENLKIIEINGAGAEATHIWDSKTKLRDAYKTLMTQYKTMFQIGLQNKKNGCKPISVFEFRKIVKRNKVLKNKFPDTY